MGVGPVISYWYDYDTAAIDIDTQQLAASAKVLQNLAQSVADHVTLIQNILSNLALSWAGTTQAEADSLTTQWNTVMTQLFGLPDGSQVGVLNALASGTQGVAAGFAQTEVGIQKMFAQFSSGLNASSGDTSTPTSAPQPVTDTTQTAITETW
ncbi:WXG100 family type VII secretion target [Streptomyces sp.]